MGRWHNVTPLKRHQGQKSWKHDFEIAFDPKGSTNFLVGFCGPRLIGVLVGPRPFLGPKKFKMANKAQNRDFDGQKTYTLIWNNWYFVIF